MQPDEQLEWERRAGRPAGLAAIAAALLMLGGAILYPALAIGQQQPGAAEALRQIHDTPAHAYVPGVLQSLAYLLMTLPLYYLYRATKPRRPELLTAAKYFALAGPAVTAAAFLAHQIAVVQAANDFADDKLPAAAPPGSTGAGALAGVATTANERANDLLSDAVGGPLLVALQYAGVLSVAFAFVLLSLNAMRAGLLSRFMGYIGIIIGVLTVIPLFAPAILQVFWFAAIGLLLLDRWPNGRGPAWSTVEAIPWPSAMEQREALQEPEEDELDEDVEPDEDYEPEDEPEPVTRSGNGAQPRPVSRKRKKKKRR